MGPLHYLEFNLLYKRYDQMTNVEELEYMQLSGQYVMKCVEAGFSSLDMVVHKIEEIETDKYVITPLTLSEIYNKYFAERELMEMTEELSDDYFKFIFHKVTNEYYLKYLTDQELIDYENFINRKINENQKYNEILVKNLNREIAVDSENL